ncbi:MAG: hypothetical protein RI909_2310 [Bacteroidota bacterium]|jgi:hypothetical protein
MMIALPLLLAISFAWQEVVPYKPANEYEVIIDYKFEERPPIDRTKVEYDVATDEKNKRAISGPLPYLKIQLKLLKLNAEEVKVRVINSNGNLIFNRKATEGTIIKIDLGFIDDVKDHVAPYEFTATLYSDSKKSTSQIHLVIMEDGTFMVNDEKKGKF